MKEYEEQKRLEEQKQVMGESLKVRNLSQVVHGFTPHRERQELQLKNGKNLIHSEETKI